MKRLSPLEFGVRSFSAVAIFVALAILLAVSDRMQAQTTWTNGVSSGSWSVAANWSPSTEPTTTTDVILPAPLVSTGTIILSTGEVARTLTSDASYTLTGGALALSGTNVTVNGSAIQLTINSTFTGAGSGSNRLTKLGDGTLYLTANNSSGGGLGNGNTVTINGGVLRINAENNLGGSANTVLFGGGTLRVSGNFDPNSAKTFTVLSTGTQVGGFEVDSSVTVTLGDSGQIISGTGGLLVKSGAGLLSISRANTTFDGVLRVDLGTLSISGDVNVVGDATNRAAIALNGGVLSIDDNTARNFAANLRLDSSGTVANNRTSSGAGVTQTFNSFVVSGSSVTFQSGTFVTSGNSIIGTGTTTLTTSSTFNILNSTTGGTTTVQVGALANGGNTLSIAGNGALTQTGTWSGAGGLTLGSSYTGTAVFNQINTYTGTTTISGGVLLSGTNDVFADSSAIKVSGGTLNINTRMDTVGLVTLISGTIAGTTGVLTGTSGYAVESGAVTARLAGSAGLTKTTAGTVTLSGSNTFGGATTIDGGTLSAAAAGALGSTSSITVNEGGTLLVGASGAVKDDAAITLVGGTLGASAEVTETLGALTLTSSSVLDFGAGAWDAAFTFAHLTLNEGVTFSIWNWMQEADQVFVTGGETNFTGSLANISFYSDSGTNFLGTASWGGVENDELVIAAIPEPATILCGLLLLGIALYRENKRLKNLLPCPPKNKRV